MGLRQCEYHKTGLPSADLDFNLCANEARHNIKVERTNPDIDLDVEDREYGFCDKHFERHFHNCTVHGWIRMARSIHSKANSRM